LPAALKENAPVPDEPEAAPDDMHRNVSLSSVGGIWMVR
jgi:hypothetical protein